MRIIALLLLAHLFAADREVFTLADGRVITGTYDDKAGQLALDGGLGMVAIKADQIAARAPAKPIETDSARDNAMTPEEKAKAVEGFKEARKQAAADVLDAFADRTDKDAEDLIAKSKAFKDRAKSAAEMFHQRSIAEKDEHSVTEILRDPIILKQTNANNHAILTLLSESDRFAKQALEKQDLARAKRGAAAEMRDGAKDPIQGPGGPQVDSARDAIRRPHGVSGNTPPTQEDQAAQMDKDADAVEARLRKLNADIDTLRVNPTSQMRGVDSPVEWRIGTPEYEAREKRLKQLLNDYNGLFREMTQKRDSAAKLHAGLPVN